MTLSINSSSGQDTYSRNNPITYSFVYLLAARSRLSASPFHRVHGAMGQQLLQALQAYAKNTLFCEQKYYFNLIYFRLYIQYPRMKH